MNPFGGEVDMKLEVGRRLSRREFVRAGGILAAAAVGCRLLETRAAEAAAIPRRPLGRTGAEVSILGLGTAPMGHRNSNHPELPPLLSVFSEAIERGINYLDTARIYGRAEEALGEVLAQRRDKVFLVTKIWAEEYGEAEKKFNESLHWLKVDHVDLLHLHSTGDKNIDKVLGEKGSWAYFKKMKKEGRARFLGLTGHSRPANFVRMIEETGEVDAIMVAMNFVDRHTYGFEEKVLPVARKHGVGVMAMKVFGGIRGSFPNYGAATPHPSQMERDLHGEAVRYALSLEGVTGMVIGVHDADQLRQNIQRVLAAKPLEKGDLAALIEKGKSLAGEWGPRFGPVA
jgi:predicted aldo/keto reductase-like oxidoreductase